jgi:hypothetical protein
VTEDVLVLEVPGLDKAKKTNKKKTNKQKGKIKPKP